MIDAGLILEGGGMRGLYTAGVLDCLMDEDYYFTQVYGVSAGACHATSYCSRQRGRALRTVLDFFEDKRYMGLRSFLKTGDFFGVQMIYDEIPNKLLFYDYDAFAASGMKLCAVMTNCRTGQAEYMHVKDMRADVVMIRASSSLPALSRMVEIGGQPYLDGGVFDSIPIARSIADGNRKNLVVLTQHDGFRKQPSGMLKVTGLRYHRWPQLVQSVRTRHLRYNEALDLIAAEKATGGAFVIQPKKPVEISRLEKDRAKLEALYQDGYDDAKAALPELRRFLELE